MAGNNYLNTFPELNKLSQNLEAKTVKRYTSNINQAFTVSILGKKFDSGKVVNVANAKSFCKKIIIDTGVHIEISTTKTKADMTFIVSGKQTNVEEAKKRIVSSIQTQDKAVSINKQWRKNVNLDVPVKYRRPLIGLNGETVRKLCSTFKVQIVIPPKEEYKNIIKITGPQQNLEQVVKEIKALMEDFDNKQLRARIIQTANDHKKISRKENPADKKTIGEVQCMQEHTSDTSSGTIIPMSSQIEDEHIVGKAYNQELQVKLDSYASKLKKPKIDHQRQQPPSIIPPKTDVQISNDHKINAHETKSDENQTCVGDSQGLQENPMDISESTNDDDRMKDQKTYNQKFPVIQEAKALGTQNMEINRKRQSLIKTPKMVNQDKFVVFKRQQKRTIDLDVPVKYRRPLIGLNGETVRKLCSTFKVQIVIPPKEEYKNIIKITGPQQNLEQVVKEIKALMEDFDNKQLRARIIQTANDHKKISRKENPADKKTIGEVQCMQEHTSDTSGGTIIPMSSQIVDEHIVVKAYNQELQVKSDTYASKLKNPKIDLERQLPLIVPPKTDGQVAGI